MQFETARQVRVREHLDTDEIYGFGAILVNDHTLVAMDNGAILDASAPWIEIVETLPWITLSEELLGE